MTRQIKRFIDVEIAKGTSRISVAGFNIPLCLTDNALISTSRRLKKFTTYASVAEFFGSTSEEAKLANAYYYQNRFQVNQPEKLWFGRFANASTAALLECGTAPELDYLAWQSITDGEFKIVIDGGTVNITACNFSTVTSLEDVASVIDTKLGANGDCYYKDGRFNINSATTGAASTITLLSTVAAPAGTDISGTGHLDGDVIAGPSNLGGSILSQGQILETVETAISAIEEVDSDWYCLGTILSLRDVADTKAIMDSVESREKIFVVASNDTTILTSGSTTSVAYYGKNLNYKHSAVIYSGTAAEYSDWSWLGQQLPKDIGSTNWAFKALAGVADGAALDITPDNLTEAQINAALEVNCNVYTPTLGSNFTYNGTMVGGKNADKEGEYIDIIRNIHFLLARTEEGLLALLLECDIIPMTNAGITTVEARLRSILETYGVDSKILTKGSIVTYFPKRSDISQADRDDRLLPDGRFTADLQGAVDKIILRGTLAI
jgi:hypothetical protein